jgi:hypothetical protein
MKKLSKQKQQLKDEPYYVVLNRTIDQLFEEAWNQDLDCDNLSEKSGLNRRTVIRLLTRQTRYPQFRTVAMLAQAVGGRLDFTAGVAFKKIRIHWTPERLLERAKTKQISA